MRARTGVPTHYGTPLSCVDPEAYTRASELSRPLRELPVNSERHLAVYHARLGEVVLWLVLPLAGAGPTQGQLHKLGGLVAACARKALSIYADESGRTDVHDNLFTAHIVYPFCLIAIDCKLGSDDGELYAAVCAVLPVDLVALL